MFTFWHWDNNTQAKTNFLRFMELYCFFYSSVAMSSAVVIWTRWGRKVHEEEKTCWDCSGVSSDNRLNMCPIFCPRHQKYTRSAVEQRNTRDRVCHGRANQIMVCQATMCLHNHEGLPMSLFLYNQLLSSKYSPSFWYCMRNRAVYFF